MFKYSNNIKLKNKPKKESLDELSKRGITVYDNKGNAVNSASNGNALTDVIKKTVTKAKSTVNNTLNNVKTPSSSASTVSAPEVTAKNIGSITYNTALKANTSALDKKGITVYDKAGKPFSTTV